MNIQNWKIFDKKGSQINWVADPMINLIFDSPTGRGAEGFLITDPSGTVVSAEITNSGYLYEEDITLSYAYTLSDTIASLDASINYKDVSVFNPESTNTKGVESITNIDASGFVYPSATYAAAIFLEPVSQGLIETEHLFIFEETSTGYIRPHDASEFILIMEFVGDDDEIKFFEVNDETQEITWSDAIAIDVSIYAEDIPIQVNIGFRAEVEGVFERILRVYHLAGNTLYTIADIVVNAESIGEDERFRTLISNFGLPDPKDITQIFKETDINEDLPDWEILNYKSKHMILEHDKIMPYVGTYKALINAIKWLGYDDIFVREWFLNVKENKKLSFIVPFDAKDRTQTILMFNAEQRRVLKKLNELTLNYCITRETGEIDTWGTPLTENCYSYNIKEVFIKLLGLKQWLERHIIGVNCRITDITGEGIYFERIQNLIYATDNIGYEYSVSQSLTPFGVDGNSELVTGDASVRLSFLELSRTTIADLPYRFIDMASAAWHPDDPSTFYSIEDPSYLADPSSYLLVGATFGYPFKNISDILYRLSTEKEVAGVITENLVTNPLFVYNYEIRFYDIFDSSTVFYDTSTNLTVLLETAYLRDPSIDEWTNSIAYSIYPDPCNNYDYVMESSTGDITYFNGYATFTPESSSRLEYSVDDNYHVPLLRFNGFKYTDASGITLLMGDYYLDIIDGKIYMNAGIMNPTNSSDNLELYLNFHYDTDLTEQMITVNPVYTSPRMILWQIDPSIYYWADPSEHTGGNDPSIYIIDNSIYTMHVNHIGDYNIELFAWDAWNTIFFNVGKETYPVWIKSPTLYMLLSNLTNGAGTDASIINILTSKALDNNLLPIYDRYIPLQGLRLEFDTNGDPYIVVPSITFFQDLPEENSINKFFNLTERVTNIDPSLYNITIDNDYQSFSGGDVVRLVKFHKGDYDLVEEVILPPADAGTPTFLEWILPVIPTNFVNDDEHQIYVLNDTSRNVTNVQNINGALQLDVSGYTFLENQLVGVLVTDGSSGYTWGSSYRVIDVSGSIHTFDNELPQNFIDSSSKYTIQVKHAFSSFSTFSIPTESATEVNNEFRIYLKDSYCQEYYLDNTFIYMNILFDQERINDAWYDPSLGLHNEVFYYYKNSINTDTSSLVIIRAIYNPSTYMLEQNNIFTARFNDDNTVYFKVFNESVPIIFNEIDVFNVKAESYDKYGNLIESEVAYINTDSCNNTVYLDPTIYAGGNIIWPPPHQDGYGYLYNWWVTQDALLSSNNDWHVPTHSEWTTLERSVCAFLGNTDCTTKFPDNTTTTGARGTNEGNALKSCRQEGSPLGGDCSTNIDPRWLSDSTHYGTDELNFSSLPGGIRNNVGAFLVVNITSPTWSSTAYLTNNAWSRDIHVYGARISRTRIDYQRKAGLAIRLVKNANVEELILDDGTFCQDYIGNDGKKYKTIKIGTQVWLTTNLAETKYRNGDIIPFEASAGQGNYSDAEWIALTSAARCAYNNNESYVTIDY